TGPARRARAQDCFSGPSGPRPASAASHTLTVVSIPADARCLPSGLKATPQKPLVGLGTAVGRFPDSASRARTPPACRGSQRGPLAEARRWLSGLKAAL